MKLKVRAAIVLMFIIFTGFIYKAECQVVVEKSKDKVTIAGKPYYIHIVKKGETVYSISKAYGIPEIDLTKENPTALYGVKENQSLKIPFTSNVVAAEPKKDESKYIYHKLGSGDTVYSLSKKYDVSEDQIITSNPTIDIYSLSVGTEIAIPRKQLIVDQKKFEIQDTSFFLHKVEKGESLSSISRKYGITVKELRKENNGLLFPRVNDNIRIPRINVTDVIMPETVIADTVTTDITDGSELVSEKPLTFTALNKLSGSVNVALLLPFYLDENADRIEIDSSQVIKGKKIYKDIVRPEQWIYGSSVNFIEMYQGILLAVDTLRSLGLNINLNTFDIKSDSLALKNLIDTDQLRGMDLIIGPVYSNNLSIMASYANKYGIPVVSPVPLKNNSVLVNNSNLFMINPSLEAAQEKLAVKISDYYNHNLVFIHSDSAGTDPDVNYFKDAIFRELTYKVPYDEIRFREFVFYSRSAFDNDSINRLGHALSSDRKNLVIVASEAPPVMDETITNLDALSKQYDITILGYPAMQGLKNTDPKYFFDNGIMLYSPFWIDFKKENVKRFLKNYRLKFFTEPGEASFAWQGYDLAYYFMSGIAVNKNRFAENISKHYPELLETSYDFRRKSVNDGFENVNFFLIQYTDDMEIKVIDENGSDAGVTVK